MGSRLALIAVLAGALAFPAVASARDGGGHHGGGRGSGGGSHGHSFGGRGGGSHGGGMPRSGPRTGFYRGNRGAVGHAPRMSPRVTQHHYRAAPQYRVGPQVTRHAPRVYSRQNRSQSYTHRQMRSRSGAHYRRYRHRRHGYAYYRGGWWYAFPWWLGSEPYYEGGYCDNWANRCAYRYGYGTWSYYRCMEDEGCD